MTFREEMIVKGFRPPPEGRPKLVTLEMIQAVGALAPSTKKGRNGAASTAPSGRGRGLGSIGTINPPRYLGDRSIPYHAKDIPDGMAYLLDECPFDPNHGKGESGIFQNAAGMVTFSCKHDSCAAKTWVDFKGIYGEVRREDFHCAGDVGGDGAETVDYNWLTCEGLDDAKLEIKFLIDRVLVAGQPCMISGPSKVLKTSLGLDAAISMATRTPFADQFEVSEPIRVGFMSGESGLPTIRETARRICRSKGFDLRAVENLVITGDLPRFDSPAHLSAVQDAIKHHNLSVLVVDPLYLALPGANTASLTDMGSLLRSVNLACQNCTLVLIHHSIKRPTYGTARDPFGPPQLEDVHGAGILEWSRQFLQVARREAFVPGTGSHHLWLSVGGSAGFSGLWHVDLEESTYPNRIWEITVERASDVRQEAKTAKSEKESTARSEAIEKDCQAILAIMLDYPDGETKNFFRELAAAQFGHTRFDRAFAHLLHAKHIISCQVPGKKGNNRSYLGYTITPESMEI